MLIIDCIIIKSMLVFIRLLIQRKSLNTNAGKEPLAKARGLATPSLLCSEKGSKIPDQPKTIDVYVISKGLSSYQGMLCQITALEPEN